MVHVICCGVREDAEPVQGRHEGTGVAHSLRWACRGGSAAGLARLLICAGGSGGAEEVPASVSL